MPQPAQLLIQKAEMGNEGMKNRQADTQTEKKLGLSGSWSLMSKEGLRASSSCLSLGFNINGIHCERISSKQTEARL